MEYEKIYFIVGTRETFDFCSFCSVSFINNVEIYLLVVNHSISQNKNIEKIKGMDALENVLLSIQYDTHVKIIK